MTARPLDDLRPLWSLLGNNAEVTAFEAESRLVMERAASLKVGTMLAAAMCIWQAATVLSTNNSSGGVAWAAAAFIVVTGARIWWRLMPSAAASDRYSSLLEAFARGEITAWRADSQQWRRDRLYRVDPAVFRHAFARLNFGRSAFGRWCADWSWYSPASPDLLVAGLPSRIVEREAPPSDPAVVTPAAGFGPLDRPKVNGRPSRRSRRNTAPGLPLFDNCRGATESQPSVDAKVDTSTSESQSQGIGGAFSPTGARPQLLTIAEVMRMLGMSRSSFYRLIRNSEFPAPLRIGHSVRYNGPEVEAWIEAQRRSRSGE